MSWPTKRHMCNLQIFDVPHFFAFRFWILAFKEQEQACGVVFVIERLKVQCCCVGFAFYGMNRPNFNLNVAVLKDIVSLLALGGDFRSIVVQKCVQFRRCIRTPLLSNECRNLITDSTSWAFVPVEIENPFSHTLQKAAMPELNTFLNDDRAE